MDLCLPMNLNNQTWTTQHISARTSWIPESTPCPTKVRSCVASPAAAASCSGLRHKVDQVEVLACCRVVQLGTDRSGCTCAGLTARCCHIQSHRRRCRQRNLTTLPCTALGSLVFLAMRLKAKVTSGTRVAFGFFFSKLRT